MRVLAIFTCDCCPVIEALVGWDLDDMHACALSVTERWWSCDCCPPFPEDALPCPHVAMLVSEPGVAA
jgi:hypothetical protein